MSALVVAASATTIRRFNQDDDIVGEDDEAFDEYDEFDSNNVTSVGGRKGKICKFVTMSF